MYVDPKIKCLKLFQKKALRSDGMVCAKCVIRDELCQASV